MFRSILNTLLNLLLFFSKALRGFSVKVLVHFLSGPIWIAEHTHETRHGRKEIVIYN